MKKLLVSTLLLFIFINAESQNAYYDVLAINKINETLSLNQINEKLLFLDSLKSGKNTKLYIAGARKLKKELDTMKMEMDSFIKDPFKNSFTGADIEFLLNIIEDSENLYISFLSTKKKGIGIAGGSAIIPILSAAGGIANSFSNFNGTQESNFYKALSGYITTQFKEGVTKEFMQFIEKYMTDYICDFQFLFPDTYELVTTTSPLDYAGMGGKYKEAFTDDLNNLLSNTKSYLIKGGDYTFYKNNCNKDKSVLFKTHSKIKNSSIYPFAIAGVDIGDKLLHDYHPVDLFNYMESSYYDTTKLDFNHIGNISKFINTIQFNFRDTSKAINGQFDNVWINYELLNQFLRGNINGTQNLELFSALIYHEHPSFFNSLGLKDSILNYHEFYKKKITPIYELLLKIQEFAKETNDKNNSFETYTDLILDVIEVTIDFIRPNTLSRSIEIPYIPNTNDLKNKIRSVEHIFDIYNSIQEGNYSLIIESFVQLLSDLTPKKNIDPKLYHFTTSINEFGGFMEGISKAQNEAEMKDAIKTFVAPPTSFINKRSRLYTLSISAHPGVYAAWEKLRKDDTLRQTSIDGLTFGLTMPVGLEFTRAITKKRPTGDTSLAQNRDAYIYKKGELKEYTGWSIGLFANLIDLGALFNIRVGKDATSVLPNDIRFQDILSPGAWLNVGIKNSGFTIGLGYQYTPSLREINTGDESVGKVALPNAHRGGLRISYDVPLYNIWSSKKLKFKD